jgi:hypothetical protein
MIFDIMQLTEIFFILFIQIYLNTKTISSKIFYKFNSFFFIAYQNIIYMYYSLFFIFKNYLNTKAGVVDICKFLVCNLNKSFFFVTYLIIKYKQE